MVKTYVVEDGNGRTRFPFLRGILTRSLQHAGLTFDEAYAVADSVRELYSDTAEVSSTELRETVLERLSAFGSGAVQRYRHPSSAASTILVRDHEGHTTRFSREQHRRLLQTSGLSDEEAANVTTTIHEHLLRKGVVEIPSRQLGFLTYRYLRFGLGAEAAQRYLVLVNFLQAERPLVLLIGGAPGTGKSAVATEIAERLEIVRIQSTDLLREVMRQMLSERLVPVLYRSSYDAWRSMPGQADAAAPSEELLVDAYHAQVELLSAACEAVIQRSLRENASLILEGVHVNHGLIDKLPDRKDAIIVPIVLAVRNPTRLRARFKGRGDQARDRRAERYLQHFESIWRLQSQLLSEADRSEVPIIVNDSRQQVTREVMMTIMDALKPHFTAKPSEVFI